ncbi:MAG TPA: pentapeptide repeat-containing protein [Streptosporangiaceae bacterium]|nr:pentapeptide repeat-containing protein [Streptosporangiaceae bacterium]
MPPDSLADLPYAATLTPHTGTLAADGDYEGAHFDGLDLAAPRAPGSRFIECAFTQVSISDGVLRRARFTDVWLRGVRLTATELADTSWTDATIIGSVAAGVSAHGALLRRVAFRGCKLDGVNFRGATLDEVSFADCLLRDVDFAGATLRRCRFPDSRLSETDFSQVTLDKVDLRGAELGIIITPGSLRGAIISTAQLAEIAPLLAEHAGIMIAED